MESGKTAGVLCIRVCDTRDNAVLQQNRAIAIQVSASLQSVFWSVEIKMRSPFAARLKATATTLGTEAVEIRDQMLHEPFNQVEADVRAGMGEVI